MTLAITASQVEQFAPAGLRLAPSLAHYLPLYEIGTGQRIAMFMAQVAHESGGFKFLHELWGPTPTQQRYQGRADLGNTQPGDGARYKGRGLIQITGRANYAQASLAIFGDHRLTDEPSLLEEPDAAVQSACWYWDSRHLNEAADAGDFKLITKRINGGLNGYDDRLRWLDKARAIWMPH